MDGRALVAWNLRQLRVERGLSQEALGVEANVDRTYVGGLERGSENPTVAVLDRLAAALGVPVSQLLDAPRSDAKRPEVLKRGRRPDVARGKPRTR